MRKSREGARGRKRASQKKKFKNKKTKKFDKGEGNII